MCRRAGGVVWLFVFLTGAATATTTAEEVEAQLDDTVNPVGQVEMWSAADSLRGELERLGEQFARARVRVRLEDEAYREALREELQLDSLLIGPLRVLAEPKHRENAARHFEAVWTELEPVIGSDTDLDNSVFLFDPRDDVGSTWWIRPREATGTLHHVTASYWKRFGGRNHAEVTAVRGHVDQAAAALYPPDLRAWVGGDGPLRVHSDEWQSLYRRLALVSSPLTRDCVNGNTDGCWAALGVGGGSDPIANWRPSESRDPFDPAAARWTECYEESSQAACTALRSHPEQWMPLLPMPQTLRADLVSFALERGGNGSLQRLIDVLPPEWDAAWSAAYTTESGDIRPVPAADRIIDVNDFGERIRDGLSAASGMDADTLMKAWYAELLAANTNPARESKKAGLATIIWVLLFGTVATRSTRWRLG